MTGQIESEHVIREDGLCTKSLKESSLATCSSGKRGMKPTRAVRVRCVLYDEGCTPCTRNKLKRGCESLNVDRCLIVHKRSDVRLSGGNNLYITSAHSRTGTRGEKVSAAEADGYFAWTGTGIECSATGKGLRHRHWGEQYENGE